MLDLLTSVALSLSAFPHTPMANLAHDGLVKDSMTAPFTELRLAVCKKEKEKKQQHGLLLVSVTVSSPALSPVPHSLGALPTSCPPAGGYRCCLSDHYGQGRVYRSHWILKWHRDSGRRKIELGGYGDRRRRDRVWNNSEKVF